MSAAADLRPALSPRAHQAEALDDLARAFLAHRRAQLVMACGSGKTYVGAWHAQRTGARTAVVLAPSLALVQQLVVSWREVHPTARVLVVCSDPTTTAGMAERAGDDDAFAGERDRGPAPTVTTRPAVVAHFLQQSTRPATDGALTLLVGTYHSSPAIAEALTLTDEPVHLDLLVCDEAHQLAGRVSDAFATALRDSALPVRQRLFMTATPVLLGNLAEDLLDDLEKLDVRQLLSMDDEATFGPVAHRLSAGAAIAAGLLTDYRVLVVAGDPGASPDDDALRALVDAAQRHGVRRVLTFHNRVAGARQFAARLQSLGTVAGVPVHAEAVDGSMSTAQVRAALGRLGDPGADRRLTVVASSRVLREGVDVPAVDGVLFADPRTSNVDIVQAVGRALRTHPGKTRGTIVVPLPVRPDEDDDDQLSASRFGAVWRVLRGLRLHDDRVAGHLDEAARRWNGSTNGAALPWLDVVGVDPDDLDLVLTRIVRGTSAVWEQWYGLLQAETTRLGSAAQVTTAAVVVGRKLGVWLGGQRWLHNRGLLRADKSERLEQLPGWSWDSQAASHQRTVAVLAELAERAGTVAEHPAGDSRYAGLRDGTRQQLGKALVGFRHQHRIGALGSRLAEQLEQLPGWTWEPLTATDRAAVEALRSFVRWEKHCDVPLDHVEGDVQLGAWVKRIRRLRLRGQLPPAVADEVLAVAPAGHKGATTWSWDVLGAKWDLGYDALQAYAARLGTCLRMPVAHTEPVDGQPVAVYQWASTQRMYRSKGTLEPARAALLAQVPGWVWTSPGVTRAAGEPLQLGGDWHGRAKGAAARCPCQPCLDYSRHAGRKSIARHRSERKADGRSAEVIRRVQQVRDDIARRTAGDKRFERPPGAAALAIAADVPVGVVRDLLAGNDVAVDARETSALLSLTAQSVLGLFDTVGSRGRLTMSAEQPVDAAPTLALIAELYARGFDYRWQARELGYRQLAIKLTGPVCARRVAEKVAALYARVGDLVPLDVGRNGRLAPLTDLLAGR